MAKISNVQASELPSQQIIAKAQATTSFTDSKGRQIVLRQIRGSLRMRFLKMLADQHENGAYVAYATLASCVASVDGDPVTFPQTQGQLEALVERFDDGMLDEIGPHYREAFMQSDDEAEEAAKN